METQLKKFTREPVPNTFMKTIGAEEQLLEFINSKEIKVITLTAKSGFGVDYELILLYEAKE